MLLDVLRLNFSSSGLLLLLLLLLLTYVQQCHV
jgi:hypothetical protein